MKKIFMKKTASAIMAAALLLSLSGCLDLGGAKKAVLASAEAFAETVTGAKADAIIKCSSLDKKSKEATVLTDLLTTDGKSDDDKAFYQAVERTIEYEIDEESYTNKKGTASVDIVFTIADYESVLDTEYTKIDDLTAAVKKADTKEFKFTAEFVKNDDKEWVVDNINKKFVKLFDYRNQKIELALTADMIKGFIDRNMSSFWLADDAKYKDTLFIEYNYYFSSDVLAYKDRGVKVFFKLLKDGKEVFTGEEETFGISTNVKCKVSNENLGLKNSDYLEAGSYEIDLFMKDLNGEQLVDKISVSVEKSAPKPNNKTFPGEGDYFTFRNSEFKKIILACGWLNTDNTLKNAKTYSKDVKKMCFSYKVDPSCTTELDYAYYYSEKSDKASLEAAMKTAVYHASVKPKQFPEGYFYDFLYTMDQAKTGVYIIAVFEHGTNNIIMVGYVTVS